MKTALASLVFASTYVLIASGRFSLLPVGRPAGALLGAVAMVALAVLTPEQAYAAIDGNTLVLLFGLMALSAYLERGGVFQRLASYALALRLSGRGLLVAVVFGSGILSAFLLNDTVCLVLTPIVCELCVRRKLPLGPYLLALATSANIGSAATLVGNPQNILIGSIGKLEFVPYLAMVGPAALLGLCVNAVLCIAYFGRAVSSQQPSVSEGEGEPQRLARAPLWVFGAVTLAYLLGAHLAFSSLCGVAALVMFDRREPRELFASIDWGLITFFAALFVVTRGFAETGLPAQAWQAVAPHVALDRAGGVAWFSAYTLVGSNVFSNVPLAMLTAPLALDLSEPERALALLAFVSTVAGNLTLLGSVANLIVAERARQHYELGFVEYLRFGLVSTAVVLLVCVPLVCLLT